MDIHCETEKLPDAYVAAYLAGDAAGCASSYLDGGAIYSIHGPPAIGKSAILALHEDWVTAGEINKTMKILDVRSAGNLATCLVQYAGRLPLEDGTFTTEQGTSLNTLERQTDGQWRFMYSSLNADFKDR